MNDLCCIVVILLLILVIGILLWLLFKRMAYSRHAEIPGGSVKVHNNKMIGGDKTLTSLRWEALLKYACECDNKTIFEWLWNNISNTKPIRIDPGDFTTYTLGNANAIATAAGNYVLQVLPGNASLAPLIATAAEVTAVRLSPCISYAFYNAAGFIANAAAIIVSHLTDNSVTFNIAGIVNAIRNKPDDIKHAIYTNCSVSSDDIAGIMDNPGQYENGMDIFNAVGAMFTIISQGLSFAGTVVANAILDCLTYDPANDHRTIEGVISEGITFLSNAKANDIAESIICGVVTDDRTNIEGFREAIVAVLMDAINAAVNIFASAFIAVEIPINESKTMNAADTITDAANEIAYIAAGIAQSNFEADNTQAEVVYQHYYCHALRDLIQWFTDAPSVHQLLSIVLRPISDIVYLSDDEAERSRLLMSIAPIEVVVRYIPGVSAIANDVQQGIIDVASSIDSDLKDQTIWYAIYARFIEELTKAARFSEVIFNNVSNIQEAAAKEMFDEEADPNYLKIDELADDIMMTADDVITRISQGNLTDVIVTATNVIAAVQGIDPLDINALAQAIANLIVEGPSEDLVIAIAEGIENVIGFGPKNINALVNTITNAIYHGFEYIDPTITVDVANAIVPAITVDADTIRNAIAEGIVKNLEYSFVYAIAEEIATETGKSKEYIAKIIKNAITITNQVDINVIVPAIAVDADTLAGAIVSAVGAITVNANPLAGAIVPTITVNANTLADAIVSAVGAITVDANTLADITNNLIDYCVNNSADICSYVGTVIDVNFDEEIINRFKEDLRRNNIAEFVNGIILHVARRVFLGILADTMHNIVKIIRENHEDNDPINIAAIIADVLADTIADDIANTEGAITVNGGTIAVNPEAITKVIDGDPEAICENIKSAASRIYDYAALICNAIKSDNEGVLAGEPYESIQTAASIILSYAEDAQAVTVKNIVSTCAELFICRTLAEYIKTELPLGVPDIPIGFIGALAERSCIENPENAQAWYNIISELAEDIGNVNIIYIAFRILEVINDYCDDPIYSEQVPT